MELIAALLTDMVDRPCAELAIELFGTKAPQVMYGEWPQVKNIVAREGIPLFDDHYLSS